MPGSQPCGFAERSIRDLDEIFISINWTNRRDAGGDSGDEGRRRIVNINLDAFATTSSLSSKRALWSLSSSRTRRVYLNLPVYHRDVNFGKNRCAPAPVTPMVTNRICLCSALSKKARRSIANDRLAGWRSGVWASDDAGLIAASLTSVLNACELKRRAAWRSKVNRGQITPRVQKLTEISDCPEMPIYA